MGQLLNPRDVAQLADEAAGLIGGGAEAEGLRVWLRRAVHDHVRALCGRTSWVNAHTSDCLVIASGLHSVRGESLRFYPDLDTDRSGPTFRDRCLAVAEWLNEAVAERTADIRLPRTLGDAMAAAEAWMRSRSAVPAFA